MNRAAGRRALAAHFEEPVARALASIGVSPNMVTLFGLVGAGGSAYLLSAGHLWAGGLVMLAAGVVDLLDGALARATGRTSSFGAMLDSVTDRASEAVVLFGLLLFYVHSGSTPGAVLVYLTLAGSFMVSYLRARAEGLGIECSTGIMTRPERVAALGVGLIVGHWQSLAVLVVLGMIAALTLLTTFQRLYHSWSSLHDNPRG